MRTILRVGITVGGVACVMLYPLASAFGLVVTAGIVVAGLFAGLGTAKWLERPWFGRQFDAGLRAGVIAAGLAGASVLLATLSQGARSVDQLASSSHLFGLNLGPLISHIALVGWGGIDILVVALATGVGIILAIVTTELGSFGKNQRAIQVVNQARLAAQAGQHGEPLSVARDKASPAAGIHTLRTVPAPPPDTVAPIRASSAGGRKATPIPGTLLGTPLGTTSGTPLGNHRLVPPEADPERFQATEPALRAPGRRTSEARPAESQLTEAMREALATWASDSGTTGRREPPPEMPLPGSPDSKVRAPQPSAYLNSSPPVSNKRARKKQNTEWIR